MMGATLQILQLAREAAVQPVHTPRLSGRGLDPQGPKHDLDLRIRRFWTQVP